MSPSHNPLKSTPRPQELSYVLAGRGGATQPIPSLTFAASLALPGDALIEVGRYQHPNRFGVPGFIIRNFPEASAHD